MNVHILTQIAKICDGHGKELDRELIAVEFTLRFLMSCQFFASS